MKSMLIGGTDVTLSGGYATWDHGATRYHLNWRLGENDVYHVTDEWAKPKVHYYFRHNNGQFTDAVAPKNMKGMGGSSAKFSALPAAVKNYITTNYDTLLTNATDD